MKPQSKSEIDQLGETLKHTPVSEASLIALDQFRLTFASAIDQVRRALNEQCGVQCSLRPSKKRTHAKYFDGELTTGELVFAALLTAAGIAFLMK
jgi:hypothetical protein